MFYTENKLIEYPSRSIIVDVLTRSGRDGSVGTTGKVGCRELLENQLGYYKDKYSIEQLVSGYADYNAEKGHPDEDGVESELSVSERTTYFTRLEDIDDSVIHEYVKNVLIGFKKNKSGKRAVDKENEVSRYGWEDKESGAIVEIADLEENPIHFTVDEILEAKRKLPYLLKMLQKGSEIINAHLLSFIIRREQLLEGHSNDSRQTLRIPPRFFFGLHKLDADGELTNSVYENQDNTRMDTTRGFRAAILWINKSFDGIEYMAPYYDMYMELCRVCDVLQLDLANEDPLDYGKLVIDKATCLYLASNEEYIECYGFVDKNIQRMLEEENLFKIGMASALSLLKSSISDRVDSEEFEMNGDNLSEIASVVEEMISSGRLINRVELVEKFLRICLDYKKKDIAAMSVKKGLVYGKGGRIVVMRDRFFVDGGRGSCVLTIAGYLVHRKSIDDSSTLEVMDLEDAIQNFSRNGGKGEYTSIKI